MRVVLTAFTNIEYTIELAEALGNYVDLVLMLPEEQADRFKDVLKPDLRVLAFQQPRLRDPRNMMFVIRFMREIVNLEPDILHIQRGHPWLNLGLPFLNGKCRIVTTIHDVSLHSGDRESSAVPWFLHSVAINSARKIIVHGKALKEEITRKYKRAPADIHVLMRGTNSIYTRYVKGAVEEEKGAILFFGRIWDYKGLRYLIEAEPLISSEIPWSKVIIAGRGDDMAKYISLMKNKERFEIHNERIGNAKVAELFQSASVVVLPYTDASQIGVVPLAYAFRRPVVVTDVGSLPEVVDHGKTGYIVPPRNSEKLAQAIIDVLKDEAKRMRMGQKAFEKSSGDLCWNNIAAKTVEVYREALEQKKLAGKKTGACRGA